MSLASTLSIDGVLSLLGSIEGRTVIGGDAVKWTDEAHNMLIKLKLAGLPWKKIAKKMTEKFNKDFNPEQCRSRWRTNRHKIEIPGYKETVEMKSDGSQISDKLVALSEKEMKDPTYILLAHGYDPNLWEVINVKMSRWHYRDKETPNAKISYATKLAVKPKGNEFTIEAIKAFFTELSKKYKSPVHKPTNYNKDGKLLELNIADLHLGKLCWTGDSGDHYNDKVAEERFFQIINDVLTRTKEYQFEKIIFMWSNDFFHFDTIAKTTTAGTAQDTNLQWQQMYKLGVKMLVKAIDLISQFAPVETMYIGSNHDKAFSYFATEYLYAWYRENPNVFVDNEARSRKFRKFGNSLIGYTHGNQEKKRIGDWLQVEARKEWGETLYHYVQAAHIHSEKEVEEKNGVIVRYVSSPTGTDRWHFDSGYVGAIKKAQSFIYDREYGLMDIINIPVKI